ncbi:BTAD domain-containing putative transcriptional regulator [Candidatus Chloroploca sp. Khr17]|uniref:BTAD domain-containing putative transcriptional regulator n=1 Tax=Candidatus Chloroploca sp. Khr17 TaxID=2496869 RepID=UPI00101E1351|nr:BTAD domain-containing putative transcriptional regulator [Candidatus Chloroploca sp. Khr17]
MLYLRLLGAPEVRLNGTLLSEITSKKALALLFYLAMTRRNHLRDELASLFWYDMPDAQARKNLRNILPILRTLLGDHLIITRHMVGLNPAAQAWLDVERLCAVLKDDHHPQSLKAMAEALALYEGDFLTGFYVSDAPAFEEWMLRQRDHLHQLVVHSLHDLAVQALKEEAYPQGMEATRRLLRLEPWNEKAHQLQMELLAALGERERALMQYQLCRRALRSEFAIEPTAETQAIYARIKALAPLRRPGDNQVRAPGRQHAEWALREPQLAPAQVNRPEASLFFGREEEAHRLYQWIAREQCRLLMLTGRVGMGKTALARYVAQMFSHAESKGAFGTVGNPPILWHSCRDLRSAHQLLDDWLSQLGEQPDQGARHEAREALLLAQLRRRRCLLVLDDLERLAEPPLTAGRAESFWRLIEGIVASEHQSCLLLVGREMPALSTYLEVTSSVTHSLCLGGLPHEAAEGLLSSYGLIEGSLLARRLTEQYDGAPLFLHLAARTIKSYGSGRLADYTNAHTFLFDSVRSVLDNEFAALDPLERMILATLACVTQALAPSQLHYALRNKVSLPVRLSDLLSGLQRLKRRSLVIVAHEGFALPRLMHTYVRTRVEHEHYYQEDTSQWLPQPS